MEKDEDVFTVIDVSHEVDGIEDAVSEDEELRIIDYVVGCFLYGAFILVLIGVGVGVTIFGVTWIRSAFGSPNWPTVQGEITKSYLLEQEEEGTYFARVEYRYVVDDYLYEGNRVNFGGDGGTNREAFAAIVARYEVGAPVAVYYDPDDPNSAVLDPGLSFWWFMFACGGIFLVLLVIVYLFYSMATE